MSTIEYWWSVLLRDGEIIRVSADIAAKIAALLMRKTKPSHITIKGVSTLIATSDIRRIEQTSEPVLLASQSLAAYAGQQKPVVMSRYDKSGIEVVRWQWAKKTISQRAYSAYYAKAIGYRQLESNDGGVTIAWKQPMMSDKSMPNGSSLCSEAESKQLDRLTDR